MVRTGQEHLADVIRGYLKRITYGDDGWAARLRGTRHDDQVDRLFEIAARFVDKPIEQYRSFVDEFTEQMDRIPSRLASKEPVSLELTLTISVDEQLVEDFNAELQRIELEGF